MLELEAVLVFVLVAGGSMWVALGWQSRRARAAARLAPGSRQVEAFLPSPGLIWRELVNWAGSFMPASSRDLPLLKRRLIRAGFRQPGAGRVFRGTQAVVAVLGGVAGLAAGLRSHASPENLLLGAAAAAAVGYAAPGQYLLWRIGRRKRAVERGLPNALDLLVVCVESGLGLDQAIVQVAKELRHACPEICEEFTVLNLELRAGKRRAEALHNLAERTGVEDLKKLVAVLIQTDRFGTSIAQSLRGHSDYMRVMARQRAEECAAKLAVKLVFPIFFCVLPSLFVVTVGPVMTHLVRDLLPAVENM